MKREKILNLEILNTDYNEFIQNIEEDILNGKKSTIVAINPEKIMKLKEDQSLNDFVQNAEYLIPDGVGILMASKKLGGHITNRITGVDTMDNICRLAAAKGFKIFMLGGKEEVVQSARKNIEKKYPEIRIVGTLNGYDLNDDEAIEIINASEAQILFIAMGSPKQENWIRKNRERLTVNIFQGVGGSFDVFGGYVKRAPAWMQKLGLEWLDRLLRNPSRIFRQMNLIRFYRIIRQNSRSMHRTEKLQIYLQRSNRNETNQCNWIRIYWTAYGINVCQER